MIVLPKGAFAVLRDEPVIEEVKTSLILSKEDLKPKLPNSGMIVYTSEELNHLQGCKVVFRENFSEEISIEDKKLLFFRDFNSSIYYVKTD